MCGPSPAAGNSSQRGETSAEWAGEARALDEGCSWQLQETAPCLPASPPAPRVSGEGWVVLGASLWDGDALCWSRALWWEISGLKGGLVVARTHSGVLGSHTAFVPLRRICAWLVSEVTARDW